MCIGCPGELKRGNPHEVTAQQQGGWSSGAFCHRGLFVLVTAQIQGGWSPPQIGVVQARVLVTAQIQGGWSWPALKPCCHWLFLAFGCQKSSHFQFKVGSGMVVFAQHHHLVQGGAALALADGAGVVNLKQMV